MDNINEKLILGVILILAGVFLGRTPIYTSIKSGIVDLGGSIEVAVAIAMGLVLGTIIGGIVLIRRA